MNDFEVLAERFLNCKTLDEWCLATNRAGQLVEQLIRQKKLDIDVEIQWGLGREKHDGIAFMVYCSDLERRYSDFPKNVEGVHPTIANGHKTHSIGWEQRRYTYADVCLWIVKKCEGDNAEVESIAQDLAGIGKARFRYLYSRPRGVTFEDFKEYREPITQRPLTSTDDDYSIEKMLRKLSSELSAHGYQISIVNGVIKLERIK